MRPTAPNPKALTTCSSALITMALFLALALVPNADAAEPLNPPLLRQFCNSGSGAGQCSLPRGIGVDAASGDIYVADQANFRVEKFSAFGDFLRAWGWDVVASGPDSKSPKNEIQKVTVDATGGSFALRFSGPTVADFHQSAPINFNASAAAVRVALETPKPPYSGIESGDLSVTGPDGGPWTIEFIGGRANADFTRFQVVESSLTGGTATATWTTLQDGGNFEVCVPAQGDVCKVGQSSSSTGGMSGGQGVAVDSAGNLYVVDPINGRVQKFGPEGEFLLAFGGEVNETKVKEAGSSEAEQNLCPVDPGDVCQAGTEGSGKGQFHRSLNAVLGSYIAVDRKDTASAGDDVIYVGDLGRVQEFDSEGHYIADLPDPDEVLKGEGTVNSLALDQTDGSLYLGFSSGQGFPESIPDIHKLNPAGEEECTITAHDPTAIAVGASGDVYLVQGNFAAVFPDREVGRFDSGCAFEELLFPKESASTQKDNQFSQNVTGIATSSACGIEGVDLLFANPDQSNSFIKLFGPPPQDFAEPCREPLKVAPSIDDQFVSSVTSETATVAAKINPHFWPDTAYYVQYGAGKCSEGGCDKEALAPGVPLGGGVFSGDRDTKGVLLGATDALAPDTTYYFRFVAKSSGGGPAVGEEGSFHTFPVPAPAKSDCPNQSFRIGPSTPLPDCRVYEMVSPVDKNNGDIAPPRQVIDQAAPDGGALTFGTIGVAFAEPEGGPFVDQYLAQRDATAGWSTRSLNAPRKTIPGRVPLFTPYQFFSEDLCTGWLNQDSDVALSEVPPPPGFVSSYRRTGLHSGCQPSNYQLLTTTPPPGYGAEKITYVPVIQGFSADGSVSIFRVPGALSEGSCPASDPEHQVVQVYASFAGEQGLAPKLVSVLPNGEPECAKHSSVGAAQAFSAQESYRADGLDHAVSSDGSRVYWTAAVGPIFFEGENQPVNSSGQIFIRLNPGQAQSRFSNGRCRESEAACTLAVSKEAESTLPGTNTSRFLAAAADGSTAIFLSGALEAPITFLGEDLYEFNLAKALAGEPADNLIAHGVKGILGTSTDASRTYLVSTDDLGQGATAGRPNLYLYQAGGGFTFIATFSDSDITTFTSNSGEKKTSSVEVRPSEHLSRVSPDGLHAAFVSDNPALAESVAGYDNRDVASGRLDREVYIYDATANGGAGGLVCASCNPSGARPAGRIVEQPNSDPDSAISAAARIPGWVTSLHPGSVLSTDGRRLFFESFEPLVPRDTNGRQDVYEWERASSKGDCLETIGGELFVPDSSGCLSLISSGTATDDAEFVDASADGRDAFFRTNSSLLPQDQGFQDIYDAREGGGFAPPPALPAPCQGEACQPPPAPPAGPVPGSSTPQGAGNVVVCPKGKVRKGGKCVKQKAKKHRKHHHKRKSHKRANANGGGAR
jgi:hypothetical protein